MLFPLWWLLVISFASFGDAATNPFVVGVRSAVASSFSARSTWLTSESSLRSRRHLLSRRINATHKTDNDDAAKEYVRHHAPNDKGILDNESLWIAEQRCKDVHGCSRTSTNDPSSDSVQMVGSTASVVSGAVDTARGGGVVSLHFAPRRLLFWENMVCGAISRSIAQTIMHPANTMKTILQANRRGVAVVPLSVGGTQQITTIKTLVRPENWKVLARGAGAQFVMSVPHGAVNFAVLEYVRRQMSVFITTGPWKATFENGAFGPGLDFLSSAISTICCSIVSTPQMMITDNIMAGTYPNLAQAISGLAKEKGILGFYTGWWPGLAGKIPSYALTWTFFQRLKVAQLRFYKRPPTDLENSMMGCLASAATVCIMIPMDTIKTRLVTQMNYPDLVPYKGIIDTAVRITKEEGVSALYRGLAPRLVSVVPMIGIQFGVYEYMKKVMLTRTAQADELLAKKRKRYEEEEEMESAAQSKDWSLERTAMEVAADADQPFPALHYTRFVYPKKKKIVQPTFTDRMKQKLFGTKEEVVTSKNTGKKISAQQAH